MKRDHGASVHHLERSRLFGTGLGAPQLRLPTGHAECGINHFLMITAVVDEIDVAVRQLAVHELHIGVIGLLRVFEVRLHVQGTENLAHVLSGVYGSLAYLVHASTIAEQLRRKLLELSLIVRKTRIVDRLPSRHNRAFFD